MTDTERQIADLAAKARERYDKREAAERAEREKTYAKIREHGRNALINAFPDIIALMGDDEQHFSYDDIRVEYHFVLADEPWVLGTAPADEKWFTVRYPNGGKQHLLNYDESYQDHLLRVIEEYQASHSAEPQDQHPAPTPLDGEDALYTLGTTVRELMALLQTILPKRRNGRYVLSEATRTRGEHLLHLAKAEVESLGLPPLFTKPTIDED